MKPSEYLRASIDHLREAGWVRGKLGSCKPGVVLPAAYRGDPTPASHTPGHCMRGAMTCPRVHEPVHIIGIRWQAEVAVEAVLAEMGDPLDGYFISSYNDFTAQTIDEVIVPMEKAVAQLEEQGL